MISQEERRSIAALYAFHNFVDYYLLIGTHLKVQDDLMITIGKMNAISFEKMHRVFLAYFTMKNNEKDRNTLEYEIINAVEKSLFISFGYKFKGFLNLNANSPLEIVTSLPFLRDSGYVCDSSQSPTVESVYRTLNYKRSNWYLIGLLLGLPMNTLDHLKVSDESNGYKLEQYISHWLTSHSTNTNQKSVYTVLQIFEEFKFDLE